MVFSAINFTLLIPLLSVLFDTADTQVVSDPGDFELTKDYAIEYFYYTFGNIIQQSGKQQALLFVCVIVIISVFVTNIFRYLATIIVTKIRLDVVKYLRMDIYNRVSSMHLGYFTNERKGDLMSRITNDVQEVEASILNSPKALFREPVTIIIYFIFLFSISAKLTIFTILVLPITGGALAEIVRRLKKRAVQSQESLGRIVNILDETLGGMRIVKAFNARGYVTDKIDQETDYYRRVNLSYSYKKELGSPVSEFLGVAIVCIIIYYGGSLVLAADGSLDGPQFIAYLAIFSQIISPGKAFAAGISGLQKGIASAERIFKVVDATPAIVNKPNAIDIKAFKQQIEFDHVRFAYGTEPVLKDISFTLQKGQTIALVGPSGGGKSTLADLIPRFYDPTDGAVKIDGTDIRDCDVESVRKLMGIVTQESILFNDTIFNNIAFGLDDPKEEDVIQAAKIANAHDFIMDMEEGYDTNIGDRGLKLSGGQRQRISIARAVMKNPPVLILDEATSALDSESEKLVQEALANLMKNRTSLVIAHRLSTIQHADQILVIQGGEIVERGTHDELVNQEGIYKKLSAMQNT
ncbi:Lipid A export ATP-binding/permease protein MsbA [Fulvivirga imtechensis AK7]|uniref:Lipid A export ATP-binding/permease protein MsbA n=1 Tax=Fulvivirga imtechensis AK7 TaxID=1237149 RepID=L8JS33_9BACT|nr:Lipid A export ATP-binding/permease protein MsbA [Fulvivirga imtechensis AK7]